MPRQRDSDLIRALGARLQSLRVARGLTQEQLAVTMGVEAISLSRWETGHRALSLSTLAAAAAALEVSLVELLDVKHEAPTPSRSPVENELLHVFRTLSDEDCRLLLVIAKELRQRR